MKVLFLDVDGVLNNSHTKERVHGFTGVDAAMAKKLTDWLEGKDIKIVLSSTWRLHPEMHQALHDVGIFWIDITPDLQGWRSRWYEIKSWLEKHPEVTSYAILDDMYWMLPEQEPYFVMTVEQVGLCDFDLKELETILNVKDKNNAPATTAAAGVLSAG
jgi:hypothetical protein